MTDKQLAEILADMVIIVDTREQKNQHITDFLKKNNIKYITEKLDIADYSIMLPNYPQLNLDKKFLVERKASLDELAGNFTKGRDRFQREFERITDEQIHLVVENATFKKMFNGTYRSQFPPQSYLASLLTWSIRYDIKTWFTTKDETPTVIYYALYYMLRTYLTDKRNEIIL